MNMLAASTDFVPAAPLHELSEDRPYAVMVAGRTICLLRTSETVVAFEDRCPHRGHPLSAGSCEQGVLRCALHGWEFALPSGEAVSPRAPFGLDLIDSRVVGGQVQVSL